MNGKKEGIQKLWQTVFDDSEAFVRLYFEKVYRDENALAIEKNGRIVAAVQLLPYTMTFCGEEISVAYLSGACTHPLERGKGLMGGLMRQAFDEMKQRGIVLSALIPAEQSLFDYYRRFGYTELFAYSQKTYIRREEDMTQERQVAEYTDTRRIDGEIYGYLNRKLRERSFCILHTYKDLAVILKDLNLSGGRLFVAYNKEGRAAGMAFVYPLKEVFNECAVVVKELFCDDETVMKRLLCAIAADCKVVQVFYRMPSDGDTDIHPYGMAKVLDAERLINLWLSTHPHSHLTANELVKMPALILIRLLFDYPRQAAYMSLMLD